MMKKFTLLFSFLTITLGFGQELLTAGGFEGLTAGDLNTTTMPWVSVNGGTAGGVGKNKIVNDQANAHSGDQFLFLDNDFRNVRQSFTAVPGTTYTFTCWNLFPSPQGQVASQDGITISIRNDDGSANGNGSVFNPTIGIYINPTTNPDANWHEYTFDFVAPQANLVLYVFKNARNPNTGNNNACRMDDFSITKVLSVNDLAKFNFSFSPNPTKDNLTLSASKTIDKIEIYNILGQEVKNVTLNKTLSSVDVSSLSKGIYIIKAYIEDAVGSHKFIKK